MTYAAYLRIYQPVSAFHEPDRSRWAAYAASSARPRRSDSLMVEHAEAVRRCCPKTGAPLPGTIPAGDDDQPMAALPRGECELAVAVYARARSRWRAFAEFELAN
jgi:hypothetical protein